MISMQIEFIDKEQMANRLGIINKKKRREFINPQFEAWQAKPQLSATIEAVKPGFEKTSYDSQGGE